MHIMDPLTVRVVSDLVAYLLLCVILIQRGVCRRLPIFAAYAFSLLAVEILRAAVMWHYGIPTSTYFVVYWLTQILFVSLRGAMVGEICYGILGSYRGLWKFCRDILVLLAIILLVGALVVSRREVDFFDYFAVSLQRGMEFVIAGSLVSAFLFCRFYRITVDKLVGRIGLGLCVYSLIMVLSNTYSLLPLIDVPIWEEIRYAGFAMMLALWISALWKPIPAKQAVPALLGAEQYDAASFGVIGRLRELNARLEEML